MPCDLSAAILQVVELWEGNKVMDQVRLAERLPGDGSFGRLFGPGLWKSLARLAAPLPLLLLPGLANGQVRVPGLDPTPKEILVAEESYALAFTGRVSGQDVIFVALSRDGRNWANANFPVGAQASLPGDGGVGVCGSFDGKAITVAWNAGNVIGLREGSLSGEEIAWSGEAREIAVAQADSAPSCVYLTNDIRIVAVRSGNVVMAHTYTGGDRFFAQSVPDLFNSHGIGRPAIAAAGGGAVMAWRQSRDVCDQIVLAQGQIVENPPLAGFDFDKTGFLPLSDSGVTACAAGEPAIATDGQRYFVALVQHQRGSSSGAGDPLHGFETVLYASRALDLYSGWDELDRIPLSANDSVHTGLAAAQVGTMVSALIRQGQRSNEPDAAFYADGVWTALPDTMWLGVDDVSYRRFGLARMGVNAPRPFPNPRERGEGFLPRARVLRR